MKIFTLNKLYCIIGVSSLISHTSISLFRISFNLGNCDIVLLTTCGILANIINVLFFLIIVLRFHISVYEQIVQEGKINIYLKLLSLRQNTKKRLFNLFICYDKQHAWNRWHPIRTYYPRIEDLKSWLYLPTTVNQSSKSSRHEIKCMLLF
jgi:hypothetical protein